LWAESPFGDSRGTFEDEAFGEEGSRIDSEGGRNGEEGFECGGVVEIGSEDRVK
jgi:hypothetical protein